MKVVALYIHSWFSWCVANTIIKYHGKAKYILILGRGFEIPSNYDLEDVIVLRFEKWEVEIISENISEKIESIISKFLERYMIDELYIPHIGYKPFYHLSASKKVRSVSFYQESIQLPTTILMERESKLLMKVDKCENTLYTSFDRTLNEKLSGYYYAISNEMMPLHLKSRLIGDTRESFIKYLPKGMQTEVDFGLIAGKATNRPSGIKLFNNVLHILNVYFPDATIVLKASTYCCFPVTSIDNDITL